MLLKIHQKSYESKVLFQASEALKIWGDDLIEGIEAMLKVLQARDPRWACLAEFERSGSQAKKRTCQSAFRLLPHLMQVKYLRNSYTRKFYLCVKNTAIAGNISQLEDAALNFLWWPLSL
mmetsp:Transcript_10376/g.27192  ORF Transcript_10376/g.27192 Transcript_10376/m.27192 type:complete len:120 (-) Transcript_10376:133-492(-)